MIKVCRAESSQLLGLVKSSQARLQQEMTDGGDSHFLVRMSYLFKTPRTGETAAEREEVGGGLVRDEHR